LYASFLIVHIFSFTATMDYSKYALLAESMKVAIGFSFIYFHNIRWFDLEGLFVIGVSIYLIISFILTFNFYFISLKNKSIISS